MWTSYCTQGLLQSIGRECVKDGGNLSKLVAPTLRSDCNELQKKKRLSSLGVLTGRVLPWFQFFFIQRQKNETNKYHAIARFQIKFETGELKKEKPSWLNQKMHVNKMP